MRVCVIRAGLCFQKSGREHLGLEAHLDALRCLAGRSGEPALHPQTHDWCVGSAGGVTRVHAGPRGLLRVTGVWVFSLDVTVPLAVQQSWSAVALIDF